MVSKMSLTEVQFDRIDRDLQLHQSRPSPETGLPTGPEGSKRRPQRPLPLRQSAQIQTLLRQPRQP